MKPIAITVKAGVYCRISDDREGGGLGVERQRKDCVKLANLLGWKVIDTYIDNDISAYSGKRRPNYERLLADIVSGRINALVTWHLDRLNRSPMELEQLIPILDGRDVQVQTVTAGQLDITTPTGRAIARIVSAMAGMESGQKSVRVRAKHMEIALSGAPTMGGKYRPYGHAEDRLALMPAEAKVIREMMRRFLAGESTPSICRDLTSRGITTAQGSPWLSTRVDMLLRSPRIAGWRQAPLRGDERQIADFLVKGKWEPIVSRRDVERAQALLSDPTLKPGSSSRWALSGIAACGGCGHPLAASRASATTYRYVCHSPSVKARGTDRLGHVSMLTHHLDRILTDQMVVAVRGGLLRRLLASGTSEPASTNQGRLHEIDLSMVDHAYVYGQITHAEKKRQRRQILDKLRSFRVEMDEQLDRKRLTQLSRAPTRFAALWPTLTVGEQRALLRTCASEVRLERHSGPASEPNATRVHIIWRA